jgi:hypothetical protein
MSAQKMGDEKVEISALLIGTVFSSSCAAGKGYGTIPAILRQDMPIGSCQMLHDQKLYYR